MSTQIGLSKEKKSILEIGLSKEMEGVVHKLVKFHIASSYGLNGLLGVNASRSSHDAVETAGEGRAGNETLTSVEVQDFIRSIYFPVMSAVVGYLCIHSLLS